MLDLIFFAFMIGVFVVGFYCGKKFQTAKGTWTAFTTYVGSLFD
jgi:hypothetical protein